MGGGGGGGGGSHRSAINNDSQNTIFISSLTMVLFPAAGGPWIIICGTKI